MPTIRQLPQSLVNKIAAGEVIERPASVVKELLENSIDAGAKNIELSIEGGGIDLIRISDDGCGIEPEQIPLALASHATSKLMTADDLFDVRTLGFRGEALASIAEVSHLLLRTRTSESNVGSEITVRGGEASEIHPAGCPVGTTIEIRHLFFNTPVRRKFMRSGQTEAGHITEAFTRIALAFPSVHMSMLSGSRVVYDLPASDSWRDRIRAFFGDEVADSLIPVESVQEHASLSGFVADPTVSRSNNRMQYLFLNGRHIRDRSLQHALGEAYRGLLMVGRFPICFLRMTLPPDQVDVNVHPTKMEVRFQEGGKIYGQLLQTLRHQFLTTDLTARARHVPGPIPAGLRSPSESVSRTGEVAPPESREESRWDKHSEGLTRIAPTQTRFPNLSSGTPDFQPFPAIGPNFRTNHSTEANAALVSRGSALDDLPSAVDEMLARQPATSMDDLPRGAQAWGSPASDTRASESHAASDNENQSSNYPSSEANSDGAEESISRADFAHASVPSSSHLGFQVHNRYLITQDEQGMVVIDQHALHERILYEQLRMKTEARTLESQRLLVPEPIDLTPAEAAAAIEFREVLGKIGIEIQPFGGDTILMTSYPAMLANMRPAEVLRQVIEPLMAGGKEPSTRDLLDELLHMIACKAAIKAGDRLAPDEITALLEQRYHYQDTHHCPHGRPTALFFSREQLDKLFKRT